MKNSGFVINDGVLENYNGNDKHVIIPEGVITIGEKAFDWKMNILSITIPHGRMSVDAGDRFL